MNLDIVINIIKINMFVICQYLLFNKTISGCKPGTFSCGDGDCINVRKVCNKKCDCKNCTDEIVTDCFNKTSPGRKLMNFTFYFFFFIGIYNGAIYTPK